MNLIYLFKPKSLPKVLLSKNLQLIWRKLIKTERSQWNVLLEYPDLIDDLWDFAWHDKKRFGTLVLFSFARWLDQNGYFYAGKHPLTPAEYCVIASQSLEPNANFKKSWPKAFCPACKKRLTKPDNKDEIGFYTLCSSCKHLYHRDCFAKHQKCIICNKKNFSIVIRS